MLKKYFINFSGSVDQTDPSLAQRQKLLNTTASKFANVDEVIAWTRDDILNTEFYRNNQYILDNPRGAGYWAWKPYIILETLKKANQNDWVVYCDVGKPFRRGDIKRSGNLNIGNAFYTPVDAMIEFAKQQNGFSPGVWIPHYGLAHVWTKRDCFVGMNCDSSEYHNSPHVQAGYSVWSKSAASIAFLEEWLDWCCNPTVITDDDNVLGKPNSKHFRDHRHDQSILTNLVVKHKIELFGPKQQSLNGYRNFNLILKHIMLSQSHQQAREQFSTVFTSNSPQLPSFLKEVTELLFLTELQPKARILLQRDMDTMVWQRALPNCQIDLYQQNESIQNRPHCYDGIFINHADQSIQNLASFSTLYAALKPGGFLTFGSYAGQQSDTAELNGTFSQFIAWLHLHQRFPKGYGLAADQRPNALTSGSIVNPLVSYFNHGKSCFVTLVKPKMYLLEH